MTREPDPTGFDDIVAAWQREGDVPQWPEDGVWPGDAPAASGPGPSDTGTSDTGPFDSARSDSAPPEDRGPAADHAAAERPPLDADKPTDTVDLPVSAAEPAAVPLAEEHFVPPILVGLTLIVLGLVLVTFPGWVGVPQVYGLPLGLVAIAAGLGWLVLRLWPDSSDGSPPIYLDDPDDPDGGAVL